ncbi:MAG: sigma 54-interacting transcriptional regulator [Candidatus Diapherotrites archaeon]
MKEKNLKRVFPKISRRKFQGHVYNVTTETGNLFVENVLVHNSGGLGTPPHLRVEPGLIHKVSGGVLFLDEIATLSPKAQQELLTAMQEKKYSITGQSELSSGAMTKTDPVPCFPAETCLLTAKGNVSMGAFIDSILSKNYDRVAVENGVEVFDLDEKETIITYSNSKIIPSNAERVYRRKYSGKVLKIKFDDGTELIATPDHPIKTVNGFVKAKDLKVNDVIEATGDLVIIDEKAIVNTYCKDNQRIANTFNKWIASGKKLSAKELGVDYKTIFSWKKGSIPRALKSVNQLNRKKLLPLNLNDERVPKIARVVGALFGDGGIDGRRLSRVYFSTDSNSMDDLNEFKNDILSIFGEEINSAITIKKITSKGGSGLDLSINNSSVARFFYALGVPKGDKVSQSFTVPFWVKLSDKLKKEFFSALLCCELYGNIRSSQDTISFVMAKLKKFEKEHIEFLNEIRNFLLKNRVEVKEVEQDKEYFKAKGLPNPETAGAYLFKLNSGYKNIIQLADIINFYYAKNKKSAIPNVVKNGKIFIESQKHLDSLKEEALMLRNAGKTIRIIAKETGLCKNTVWKIVGKTYNKYSKLDRKRVFGLLGKGIIPKIVAKKLEIPYTTVLYWKNNYFSEES